MIVRANICEQGMKVILPMSASDSDRDRDNSGGDSGCIVMIITVTRCGSDRSVV